MQARNEEERIALVSEERGLRKGLDLLEFLLVREGLTDGRGLEEEIFRYYLSYSRHFGKYIRFHRGNQPREVAEAFQRRGSSLLGVL
jgi:hypothetical protein